MVGFMFYECLIYKNILMFYYLFFERERQTEHEQGRGRKREREGDTESKVGSRL